MPLFALLVALSGGFGVLGLIPLAIYTGVIINTSRDIVRTNKARFDYVVTAFFIFHFCFAAGLLIGLPRWAIEAFNKDKRVESADA